MIDGGNYKAGVGERLGRIVVANEGAVPAVRDDDERAVSISGPPLIGPAERKHGAPSASLADKNAIGEIRCALPP